MCHDLENPGHLNLFYFILLSKTITNLTSTWFPFSIAKLEAALRYKGNSSCSYKSDGLIVRLVQIFDKDN